MENVLLSTQPTISGKGEITANTLNYPVKRIQRRKLLEIHDDLWLSILESEKKKLIEIKFVMNWVRDSADEKLKLNEVSDFFFSKLYKLSIAKEMASLDSGQINLNNDWNTVRGEVIRTCLNQLLYPQLETEVRDEMKEIAGKICYFYV